MTHKIIIPKVMPELAYLCGVIAGDGCITIRPEKHDHCLYCAGNFSDEQEYYQTVISPLMKQVFGITVNLRPHSGGRCFGFTISSKQLTAFLVNTVGLPVGKKYEHLHFPKLFTTAETKVAFLRGLFDTDGCISFKKRNATVGYYPTISFSSKSQRLVFQVAYHLTACSFLPVTHTVIRKESRIGWNSIKRTDLFLNGTRNFEIWQSRIGFWNPKHVAKIAAWQAHRKLNRIYRNSEERI
jgi:hypothetical protein